MNASSEPGRLMLNEDALRAAASHLDDGAVTPSYGRGATTSCSC